MCIDPGDEGVEKFAEHHLTMKGLCGKLIEMMSGAPPNKSYFNADMPYRQHEFLNKEIVGELMQAKNFTQEVLLRDAVNYLLDGMLKYWQGEFSEQSRAYLREQIDFADSAQKNKYFDWYLRFISPWLLVMARRESGRPSNRFDMAHEPMTVLLRDFFL